MVIINGNFDGKTGDALIVAIAKAFLEVKGCPERLGEYISQMPYFRRTMLTELSKDGDGNTVLTDNQERFMASSLLRIGMPYFEERIALIENRESFTDDVVAAGMRFVELNPYIARTFPSYNLAVLDACGKIKAWLELAS